MRDFLYGLMTLVVVGLVVVVGYLGGWWLREDGVNREAEIRRDSFEVQETARDEVIRQATGIADMDVQLVNPDISDQQRDALAGQRRAMVTQLCNVASDISGSVTPTVDRVISENC